MLKASNPFWFIAVVAPFFAVGAAVVMPVFDDWWYLTTPRAGMHFALSSLLPHDQYWRPVDALFGLLLAKWPQAFPVLNHLAVVAVHLGSTALVYRLLRSLRLSPLAVFVATIYYCVSPAMLGTLLNADALNQALSALFGLLALHSYVGLRGWMRYASMALLVLMAALSKENGLAWAMVAPLFAYALCGHSRRSLAVGLVCCGVVCAVYMAARLSLQRGDMLSEAWFDSSDGNMLKYVATWLSYSLLPLDYVSLMHAPSRSVPMLVLTALLSLPFVAVLLGWSRRALFSRGFVCAAVCAAVAASPHLLTVFGNMHCYSSLALMAVALALLVEANGRRLLLLATFAAYVAACLVADYSHWRASWQSGREGQRIARAIVEQSSRPANRVLLLCDATPQPGFSTFCTTPADAFGRGSAVAALNDYAWPTDMDIATVAQSDSASLAATATEALDRGFDAVWYVGDGGERVFE